MKLYYFPVFALSIKPIQAFSVDFIPPENGGDIAEDGSIIHPAKYVPECDPWKTRPMDMDTDYNSTLD